MDWRECVQGMIDYIESHLNEDMTLGDISAHVGYSPFYCSKAFHGQAGICLKDYIRLRRISLAALELRDTKRRILDIALDYGYNSQEAFTRSFIGAFDVTPAAYRRQIRPLPLFARRNVNHLHQGIGDMKMLEKTIADVKVTFLTKPARKMLVFHREGAENYHGLCGMEDAEKNWGTLESMEGTLGGVICAWLNENGETRYVWGVEMPADYRGHVPDGFTCVEMPACDYVRFCHPPYTEDMHDAVTEAAWNLSELWKPEENGWEWNDATNPVYEDDRETEGYMVLKPIKRA